MKKLARLFGVTALLGGLALLPRPPRSKPTLLAPWPRLLAAGLSPLLLISGAVGALLGLLSGALGALAAGVFGAVAAAWHVKEAGEARADLSSVFGPDWEAGFPTDQLPEMTPDDTPIPRPAPPLIPWEQDVRIGTHAETDEPLLADLWLPPRGVPRSGLGVIYLHGSGWHYLDKDFGTRWFFAHLAALGHVVLDVAYKMAPRADMQGMLNDVRRAVAWMKTEGASYGVRPDRVILGGASAGGQLALLAAYTPRHPDLQTPDVTIDQSVRGAFTFYAVTDLAAFHDHMSAAYGDLLIGRSEAVRRLLDGVETVMKRIRALPSYGEFITGQLMLRRALGGAPTDLPEMYRLYSPLAHVGPDCPPTLIVQGADDCVVPAIDHGQALDRALSEAGAPVIYLEIPGVDHGFDLFFPRWSPAVASAYYHIERFLALLT
ncbi:MAG: hypothetical protein Kow00124_23340 [Anaerolineae bacterium]